MKKKILLASLLAAGICLTAGFATACGDQADNGGSTPPDISENPNPDPQPTPEVKYTVSFETNGGSAVDPVEVAAGETIDLEQYTTQKDGFEFNAWYHDAELKDRVRMQELTPQSDVKVYAAWLQLGDEQKYTITFDSCGGSDVPAQSYYSYEYLAEPAAPEKSGYVFAGWYWTADYSKEFIFEANTMLTQDITVYAKWTQLFTISFDTDGGTDISSITAAEGTVIEVPEQPQKPGYVFEGWFTEKNGSAPFEFGALTQNVTAYAKWHKASDDVNVTYNINSPIEGVSSSPVSDTLNEGDELSENAASQTFAAAINEAVGYDVFVFGGWSANAEGTALCEAVPHVEGGSLSLYARWLRSAAYCSVTFNNGTDSLTLYCAKNGSLDEGSIAKVQEFYGEMPSGFVLENGENISDLSSHKFIADATLVSAEEEVGEELDFTFSAEGSGYAVTGYTGSEAQIEIPSLYNGRKVTAIAENAFSGNTSITSVTIPSSVAVIGGGAFKGCTALSTVNGGEGITAVGEDAFADTALVSGAAAGVIYLNSQNSVVLGYTGSAASVNLPSSLKVIAAGAFADSNITKLTVASGSKIAQIPANAFNGCENLTSVNFSGARINSVGEGAFQLCAKLSEISFASSLTSVGERAFYGCAALESIELSALRSLGEYAFSTSGITTVDLSASSVYSIPDFAFAGCASLKTVTLAANTVSIGYRSFIACEVLSTVTVNSASGSRLKSIGEEAFAECGSLKAVILFAGNADGSVIDMAQTAFTGCSEKLVIYVADGRPSYNKESEWYDAATDEMLQYSEIYASEFAGLNFAAAESSAPVISVEQSSIMLFKEDAAQPLNVVEFLLENGVSASDNATASEDIEWSIDSVTYHSKDTQSEVSANGDGLYDLSQTGLYRVIIRARDMFGNAIFEIVDICVVTK